MQKNSESSKSFTEMRSYFVPAIAIAMIMPAILSARSDDISTLDVRPVCRGIASQSELEAGLQRANFEQCVKSEQDVREQLKKEWSTFTTADKSHCVNLAKTGGESSYTESHHLYGNGARCASPEVCRSKRFLTGGHDPNSVFAPDASDAASTVDAGASTSRYSSAIIFN
jgi:hypothetical protein